MAKIKNLRLLIAIISGFLIILIPRGRANPVPAPISPYNPFLMFFYLNFLLLFTLGIEIIIIRAFLKQYKFTENVKPFYTSIVFVNLLTFPMTQIIAFAIFQTVLLNLDISYMFLISIIIEIFPITLECVLYLKIYKRLNRISCFLLPVNNAAIIKSTITANLASFALGALTFLIFLI